jgi:protein-S-isoprenylcysteine O-methyltransferase Ste14
VTVYNWFILAFWLVFIACWAVMATGAKKNIDARLWWRGSELRVGIIALALIALRLPNARAYASTGMLTGLIGVVLCASGIGLAVWARVHLGRNWGMPMSRKEDPTLVTSGPYAYVRHPIYTGVLIAMLGSAIGVSAVWSIPLVLLGVYFVYSAWREEKLLIEQFPEQYPTYMKRTKMLVPFLL